MAGKRKNRNAKVRRLLPLPHCDGPKLHAFKQQDAPIEWLERLDGERASQSGAQACVFKVRIESQLYALKVVSRLLHTQSHSWRQVKYQRYPREAEPL
jgi:hypothetical protein